MKRAVGVLKRAERDLQEIYDYLVLEAPSTADRTIDVLLAAIESLDRFADRGARPRDPILRSRGYRYLVHKRWLVFYKVLDRRVRVYRVLLGRREYRRLL